MEDYRADVERRVELLERRISKLVQTLEETEHVLERVAATKDLETGIESVFRDVQGLADEEPQRQRKAALMTALFEANLQLHDELAEA